MPTKIKGLTGVDKVEAGAVITNPEFSGNATVTGSMTVGGVNVFSGPYRNLIINGDMKIAQRGTSTTGLQYNNDNNYPCCDRWKFQEFGSTSYTASFTGSQDTDVPSGQGFVSSLKLACTTADATLESDTAVLFAQQIEAQNLQHLKYGTSSAEKLTLSFWVKSNLTGTFTAVVQHGESGDYYGVDYTIDTADTWEKKTLSYDGNTTDVINNDNGSGLSLRFYFAVGSNYASGTNGQWVDSATVAGIAPNMTNNLGGSTSNYINITGVQLEVGEGASDFEHLPYDVQLARCQRYYEVNSLQWYNTIYGNAFRGANKPHRVLKRANPTGSIVSGTIRYAIPGVATYSADSNAGLTIVIVSNDSWFLSHARQAGGSTPSNGLGYYCETNPYIAFDAEL